MTTLPPLKYGPVGDRASRDPFERAQAHAPKGWHVEGQANHYWMASGPNAEGVPVRAFVRRTRDKDDDIACLIAEMRAKAVSW
jgi:hypothetical protein